MYLLHLQYDAVLEPVQVSHLHITLRVEEDVVTLIINVTTCHIILPILIDSKAEMTKAVQ